ncbi:hypothetical protein [Phenylobacterium sp.]|uniref:hypothetical protein n=1 Tax=Phenylobacterium sp. TaxID=1871053 RepID=UPI002FE2AB40
MRIHLDRLEELLAAPRPGPSEAVQASLSLRLLADGALNQVAHARGRALKVDAPDLSGVPVETALLVSCGGYVLGGQAMNAHYTYREPGSNSPYRAQYERQLAASPTQLPFTSHKFGRFLRAPCMALLGRPLCREEVLRYVANRCGGAHHSDDTVAFKEIEHLLTDLGQALTAMRTGLSAVFAETLGTAWFILQSADVRALRQELQGARGET